jgi:hypothetical protein
VASAVALSTTLLSGEMHNLGTESDEQAVGTLDWLGPVSAEPVDADGCSVFIPKKRKKIQIPVFERLTDHKNTDIFAYERILFIETLKLKQMRDLWVSIQPRG